MREDTLHERVVGTVLAEPNLTLFAREHGY
jgi:hypothetical protein